MTLNSKIARPSSKAIPQNSTSMRRRASSATTPTPTMTTTTTTAAAIENKKQIKRAAENILSKSHSMHRLDQYLSDEDDEDFIVSAPELHRRALLSRATTTPMPRPSSLIKRFSYNGVLATPPRPKKPSKTPMISSGNFRLGQRVNIPSLGTTGIVRYYGEIQFKTKGPWLGIELDQVGSGKNDGCIQGVRYFSCPPDTGLFVLASKVIPDDTKITPPRLARTSSVQSSSQVKSNEKPKRNKSATTTSTRTPTPLASKSARTPRTYSLSLTTSKSTKLSITPSVSTKSTKYSATSLVRNKSEPRSVALSKCHSQPRMGGSVSSKTEMELERVHALLEQSREEQRALSQQMDGKEAAWERLVSAKESYALRVQEKDDEIRQLKQSLEQSRKIAENLQKNLREKDVGIARATMSEAMEQQHLKVIERLDNRIRLMQNEIEENITQNEIKMRENTAQIEQLRKQLAERDETTANLERECSDLRQASIDTIRICENSIGQLKNTHTTELMQKENQIRLLQNMLSDIQACQTQISLERYAEEEEDDENSPCRRLERQLDLTTKELDRERGVIRSMATEIDQLKDEIKRLHRVSISSSSDFYSLRMELENEIQDKRRIMEESNAALQKQARLEEENERIRLNNEKAQHDLAEVLKKLATMEKQRVGQNDYQLYHYQLENLQRQNQLLEQDNESLQDAQKQTEHECMRLMDELLAFEKIESEKTDSKKDERLLRREIEQLRSQISRERKRYGDLEQSKNTKLEKLNKELTDLESLVENKVFNETDLEEKLENEKRKVRQLETQLYEEQEKMMNTLSISMSPTSPKSQSLARQNRLSTTSTLVTKSSFDSSSISNDDLLKEELYCEICESHGHEVISCTALASIMPKDDSYLSEMNYNSCYCVNCDIFDTHPTEECPNQDETF